MVAEVEAAVPPCKHFPLKVLYLKLILPKILSGITVCYFMLLLGRAS